jgi:hypothetical protein
LEDYWSVILLLHRARQVNVDFEVVAGRLHGDYGYYAEAEQLSKEGLSLLESASDLRRKGYRLAVCRIPPYVKSGKKVK